MHPDLLKRYSYVVPTQQITNNLATYTHQSHGSTRVKTFQHQLKYSKISRFYDWPCQNSIYFHTAVQPFISHFFSYCTTLNKVPRISYFVAKTRLTTIRAARKSARSQLSMRNFYYYGLKKNLLSFTGASVEVRASIRGSGDSSATINPEAGDPLKNFTIGQL